MNKHKKIIILSLIVTLSLICVIPFIAHTNNCDSYIKKLQNKLPIEKVFGKKIEKYSMAFDGGSYYVELTDGTIISSKWDMFSGKEEITCTPSSKEYQQPNCDTYLKELEGKYPPQVFGNKLEEYVSFNDGGSYYVELTDGTRIFHKWNRLEGTGKTTCTPPSKEYQQPNCDTYIEKILNTRRDRQLIRDEFREKIKESSGDGDRDPKPLKLTFYNGTKISVDVKNDGKITCTPENSSTPIIAYYPNNK